MSKGYSMNFPTIPDIDPNATSLSASLPCPESGSLAMVSTTDSGMLLPLFTADTGPSETSMILQGAELACNELGHKYNCLLSAKHDAVGSHSSEQVV